MVRKKQTLDFGNIFRGRLDEEALLAERQEREQERSRSGGGAGGKSAY